MDEVKEEVLRFRAERRITEMVKYCLGILEDARVQQEIQVEKLGESLSDYELFVFEKSGVDVELAHLAKHAESLGDTQYQVYRKKLLDYGGEMRRGL